VSEKFQIRGSPAKAGSSKSQAKFKLPNSEKGENVAVFLGFSDFVRLGFTWDLGIGI
jgi:hypothetical protein